MSRWCDGLPAVTVVVDCGGQDHAVTWRRGKLVLEDHDVLAERALIALGSQPPRCVEILEACRTLRDVALVDGFLLGEGTLDREDMESRRVRYVRAVEQAQRAKPVPAAMARQFSTLRRNDLEREQRMWSISLLESLPTEFRRRLALSVIVGCDRRWDAAPEPSYREDLEPTLHEIAAPAFQRSVRRWRRNLKPYASVIVESRLVGRGEQARCTARIDNSGAHAALRLPPAWITEVWARGIACVDDCFVLRVADGAGGGSSRHVIAVRFERQTRDVSGGIEAPAIVTRDADGAWSLSWAADVQRR